VDEPSIGAVVPLAVLVVLVGGGVWTLVVQRLRGRAPPSGLDAIAAFGLLMWTASAVSLPLLRARSGDWLGEPDLLVAIAGTASGALASAAFCLARAPRQWLGIQGAAPRWWAAAVAVVPAFLLASAGWVTLLEAIGVAVEPQQLVGLVEATDQPAALALALVYGAVGAPLTEELLFRGLLLGVLRERLGARTAVLLQGALFGVIHGTDPAAIVPLAGLGVVLGALRVRSGSLGPSVLTHAVNNAVALGLAVAAPELL
jgi:membrane protease YdiL (CAAX protease family)